MKTITKLILILSCMSCAVEENLLVPDRNDRLIVGYSTNKKFYKVVDGYGKPAQQIKIVGDTLKPGDILIAFDEFNYN